MLLKLIASLLLLAMMGCSTVNPINTEAKHSNRLDRTISNTTLVLNNGIYEIQPNTSTIQFRVDSPVGEVWGSFYDFEGSFTMINNGASNQSAIVDIKTKSLHVDNILIKTILKSESFFNIEKHPSMHFIGDSFEWFNGNNAVLKGKMTINKVTRPVAFYVELVKPDNTNPHSERIIVKATTTIKRSEFGIHTLIPAVSDNVNLFMAIEAMKQNTTVSMM